LELKEIFSGNIPFCDPQLNVARWAAVIHYSGSYLREFCAGAKLATKL
jgi:hypothetical protein